jgi:hypothetical protein
VAYALKYWGQTNGDEHISYDTDGYNPYYPIALAGYDCQNFVSQALYEGGNISLDIPDNDHNAIGTAGWYVFNVNQRAAAWYFVDSFYNFVTHNVGAPDSLRSAIEGPVGTKVSDVSQLELGDVIQYDWWPNDGSFDHTAIVVDKVGGIPYVAAHTKDHDRVPYSLGTTGTNYRFIHIELSQGYPPVKATIEQEPGDQAGKSSNDAGTHPINPCTFFLDSPEVYFGLCPDGSSNSGGFRFKNIPIPQGAVIKYAYLTFTVDGPYSSPLDINIYGENASDSAPFTNTSQPKDRSTLGPILWPITDTWQIGQRRTTPNLSPIMNVIVGNGWQYGNSLSFIFKDPGPNTGLRRVVAFDRASWDTGYGPLFPAKLIAAYTMEGSASSAPTVYSVTRKTASPTNATVVEFEVKFSEPVTGVDTTSPFNDFSPLHIEGGITDASITAVSGSGDTYTVTVNTGNGDGKIRLDVLDDDTIHAVDDAQPLNGGFLSGEAYTIDKTAPTVSSISLTSPNPTKEASVEFLVKFSETVTGVDITGPAFDNFTLLAGGTGASITAVTPLAGDTFKVIVDTGNGSGSIALKLPGNDGNIRDLANNPLFGGFNSDFYTIDRTPPTVTSITRASSNPTNAANVDFTVTFSEAVTGVDGADFVLVTSSVNGAAITSVNGFGNTYTVSVSTGIHSGTIRLDLVGNDTIMDAVFNSLNNGFSGGETYTIDKTGPVVLSIRRLSGSPTGEPSVSFRVTFSEEVSGLDVNDFTLNTTGVSGAYVTSVSGSGDTYTVTVNTGSGDGTIRLDVLNAAATITDLLFNPLDRSFTSGEVYSIIKVSNQQ